MDRKLSENPHYFNLTIRTEEIQRSDEAIKTMTEYLEILNKLKSREDKLNFMGTLNEPYTKEITKMWNIMKKRTK